MKFILRKWKNYKRVWFSNKREENGIRKRDGKVKKRVRVESFKEKKERRRKKVTRGRRKSGVMSRRGEE